MEQSLNPKNYKKKGFDDRIVRYEQIHHAKDSDYEGLLNAIDPKEGEVIFEGCAGYADASKHIIEATKDFKQKPEIYILDESLVQIERAQKELQLPENHTIVGDVRKTEMPKNKFDKAVIKMGVHELPKEEQLKVFTEMYRILKPEGKFIIWELSLDDKNQTIFQDIIRKKDELAGFDILVKNRYFQKHDELQDLFEKSGFREVKDNYIFPYVFNPKGRFEEFVSKDHLQMLNEKGTISVEDENELSRRAQERVNSLIEYIRERIPENMKEELQYKDLGDDIEISVNKIIMSGKKITNIDEHNLKANLIGSTGEQWNHVYGGYFSNTAPLEKFWEIVEPSISINKEKVSMIELGSANANLCEFITNKIKDKVPEVESFAVDAQKEYLEAGDKNTIKKIIGDITQWNPETFFDIVLMRSVLHYNNLDNQILILKNISNAMQENSIFLNQLLSGDEATISLYEKIQSSVFGRNVLLLDEEKYLEITKEIFKEVKKVGDCIPIKISAKDMLDRFSQNEIQRKENWEKLQKVSGWGNEDEAVILKFPIFEHKM